MNNSKTIFIVEVINEKGLRPWSSEWAGIEFASKEDAVDYAKQEIRAQRKLGSSGTDYPYYKGPLKINVEKQEITVSTSDFSTTYYE